MIYLAYSCWCVLFLVWAAGHFRNKPTASRVQNVRYLATTALLLTSYALLFGPPYPGWLGLPVTPQTTVLGILGDVLCLSGALIAIWARITLGGNWSGSTAAIKHAHELVETGPYAFVRHPIYTGFLLAMFGMALTLGRCASYLSVLFGLLAFLTRIPIEERSLNEQFPCAFLTYKTRVKRLIPFVW